jgi:hypothetical protein
MPGNFLIRNSLPSSCCAKNLGEFTHGAEWKDSEADIQSSIATWGTGLMKTLLVVMFIILFIYLIIHMCSESGDRDVPTRTDKGFDISLLVLDGLQSLGGKELSRLRDDLQDLKALLDKKPVQSGDKTVQTGRPNPRGRRLKNGKEILNKIRKDTDRLEGYHHRRDAFSKFRVVLVQIALILITILMIVL